ncbi:hypothetical protein U1Q18_008969 [Sarracenia purpurea var. burkii]
MNHQNIKRRGLGFAHYTAPIKRPCHTPLAHHQAPLPALLLNALHCLATPAKPGALSLCPPQTTVPLSKRHPWHISFSAVEHHHDATSTHRAPQPAPPPATFATVHTSVNELHMEFLLVSEFLVELSDDL